MDVAKDNNQKVQRPPLIWMRKMITMIFSGDFDKDGYCGYDDLMKVADRFVKEGNLTGDAADRVYETYRNRAKPDSSNVTAKSVLAISLSTQINEAWKAIQYPEFAETTAGFIRPQFWAMDVNSDGFISYNEYLIFWRALELDPRFSRMQFDFMDTDKDGRISEEEYVASYIDYITNTDKIH